MEKRKAIYILGIILLFSYLVFRLADQSQILNYFPLDYTNDISSHMNMLHFLDKYGYHATVYEWYYPAGFVLFDVYGPGWAFFAYPLLKMFGDVKIAAFASLILLYALGLIIFLYFGKSQKLSMAGTLSFYFFFFVSPMAVGDYVRQMRLPQLAGWISFLAIIAIILYYKDRKINRGFFWTMPLFAAVIISHSAETILASFVVAGLFLVKKGWKEKAIVCLPFAGGIILSAPWLYVFLKSSARLTVSSVHYSQWLLDFSGGFKFANIAGIFISLCLFIVFAIYLISVNDRKARLKEAVFFAPIMIFNVLYLFRVIPWIPLLNNLYPDAITQFLGFFTLFLFFMPLTKKIKPAISVFYIYILIAMPFAFIAVSMYHTPLFIKPNAEEVESLSILNYVTEPYLIVGGTTNRLYTRAITCYGSIYLNLYSASGWADVQATDEHLDRLKSIGISFKNKDCMGVIKEMKALEIGELISYGPEQCSVLENCGLKHKIDKGMLCLYTKNGM